MNGRTCQLCGKPLSRLWAGGGGDFCSREHRNQYRLRCGMDTLLEASKHASLMRRRDQPRQFPVSHLQVKSNITPRSFGWLRVSARPLALRNLPSVAASNHRMNAGDGKFVPLAASGGLRNSKTAHARLASAPGNFKRKLAIPPACRRRAALSLSPAGLARIRFKVEGSRAARRSYVMLAKPSRRSVLPKTAFRSLGIEPLGNLTGRRTRHLKTAAKVGNALRVSGNAGFRLPALTIRDTASPAPAAKGLKWPTTMHVRRALRLSREIVPYPAEKDFQRAAVRLPAERKLSPNSGLPVAAARKLAGSPKANQLENRSAEWRQYGSDSQPVTRDSGLETAQAAATARYLPMTLSPAKSAGAHRVETARFEPPEHATVGISYPWNSTR